MFSEFSTWDKCCSDSCFCPFFPSPRSSCAASHSCPESWHCTHCASDAEKAQHVFSLCCQKRHKGRVTILKKTTILVYASSVNLYAYENVDSELVMPFHPFHASDRHLKRHVLCAMPTGSSSAMFETLTLWGFMLQLDHLLTWSSIYIPPSSICWCSNIHQHMPC